MFQIFLFTGVKTIHIIFSRKFNQGNIFLLTIERGSKEKAKVYKDMSYLINRKTKIYDNGGARDYYG